MKMKFEKVLGINLIILVISVMFIFPMQVGEVYGVDYRTNEQVQNTCGLEINVKDSLIFSVLTLCVPGILEKIDQWRQIKCESAVCKYNAIISGLDPSFCEKQAQYKQCKFVWGEVFAIPPMNLIEMVGDLVKEILANPIGLAFSVGAKFGRDYIVTNCPGTPACDSTLVSAGAFVLFTIDIAAAYQTFVDIFDQSYDSNKYRVNYCEEMREIKPKLEDIVNAYSVLRGGEPNE